MTIIELTEYKDAYELKADGHAGTTEACAAISAVMTGLANWAFWCGYREDQVLEPGHACVTVPKGISGAKTACNLARITLESICEDAENCCEIGQKFGQESKRRLI